MHDSIPENLTQSAFDFDALAHQSVDDVILHVNPAPPQEQKHWWSDLEHHRIPKKPGIYAIINIHNGHFYIGSAVSLVQRKNQHFCRLQRGQHHSEYLQRSYNYYGADAFLFCILEHVDHVEELLVREQHFIDTLDPHYNIARIAGSSLGTKHSPEFLEKMRAVKLGKKQSPEHVEKRVSIRRGRKHTPEAIEKMRRAKKGKKFTPEHREKLRAAKLGRKQSPEHIENNATARREKKQSPEHVKKRAEALRGKEVPHQAKATEAARLANTGKKRPPDVVAKMKATWAAKRAAKLAEQQENQPPLF